MDSTVLNPFVVGSAISDSSGRGFFGREVIFSFVRSALNSVYRPPILLVGQRRIGKSSILRQLPRHLPTEYRCIYFDLQGKGQMNLEGVLYGLAREIAGGLNLPKPDREQATEDTFDRFLQNAFEALDGHAERLVLLFDEFDVVDESTSKQSSAAVNRLVPWLADFIKRYPKVGYIFVVGRKPEELSGSLNGVLLKDSVVQPIRRLKEDEVTTLIREYPSEVLAFEDTAIKRAFELTSGHPFCVQVLCHVIWDRAVSRSSAHPIKITREDVDNSIPESLELGANGMNWIFDGLTDPAHRLVLAAIAQETDPAKGTGVHRSGIDAALRKRSVSLDAVEIDRAVRELQTWDVVESVDSGFRFCVPLIGLWTKHSRPLESLNREVRIANPRAFKFYELALDSLAQGHLDQAIEEFRDALRDNPTFAEAQRGLASALFQRNDPAETAQIIESLERAHDLDPEGPTSELLEALTRGVSTTINTTTLQARLKRIRELDPGGPFESRAIRAVSERARRLLENQGSIRAATAASLYRMIGDATEADRAAMLAKSYDSRVGYATLSLFVFTAAAFGAGFLPWARIVPWARVTMAIFGGTAFAYLMQVGEPKRLPIRWLVLIWVITAVAALLGAYFWTQPTLVAVLAYFAPIVATAAISPISSPDAALPEDKAQPGGERTIVSRLGSATQYLLRGTLPSHRVSRDSK